MFSSSACKYIFAKTKGFSFEGYNSESAHHVYAFVSRMCSTGISQMSHSIMSICR
jgi:hypothetical protein